MFPYFPVSVGEDSACTTIAASAIIARTEAEGISSSTTNRCHVDCRVMAEEFVCSGLRV